MALKLGAIGIVKYVFDTMNLLDGSVVIISIFEILYEVINRGKSNLGAMATLKLFRTFRVFRIARLLRGLESMHTILSVI